MLRAKGILSPTDDSVCAMSSTEMRRIMLKKVKEKVPVLFGIIMAVLYLVVLNLGTLGIVAVGGKFLGEDIYFLQFLGTVIASCFMILVVWRIGYGWIFRTESRGLLYNIGTSGYLLTVSGIALANNMGTYLLTKEHTFRATQPVLQILTFMLAMLGVGFAEELAFRGILTNLLREKFSTKTDRGIFLVLIIQGVLFGGCHIVNALGGVRLESAVVQAIMAGLLGIILGAVYLRTNSLWFVAGLHGLNDFCALLASGIYGQDNLSGTINSYSWVNLAGAPIYIVVICVLLRRSKRAEIKGEPVQQFPVYVKVIKGVVLTGISLFLIVVVFCSTLYSTWANLI